MLLVRRVFTLLKGPTLTTLKKVFLFLWTQLISKYDFECTVSSTADDISTGTQIDDIFIRLETHIQEVRAQMEESFRQRESENARLAEQLQEQKQLSKQQKWLKEVTLPKTLMPEQMKVVVQEHQVKVQEKMQQIALWKKKCESQEKQLQEQEEERTQLRRKVKQQRRQIKRLQDETAKLKETIEELEEARKTDQSAIQEKEEQNKEIAKWMKTIPIPLHSHS